MARKVGQIVRRGARTWLVRVYSGRDAESEKRKYLNPTIGLLPMVEEYGTFANGQGIGDRKTA